MTRLVDYAGLFPPAKLEMAKGVSDFYRHRRGSQAFALSRFICPVSRLGEWARAAEQYLAEKRRTSNGELPPETWHISVLIDGQLEEQLAMIERFNDAWRSARPEHKNAQHAVIDTVEIKVQTPQTIDTALDLLPEDLFAFFEVPLDGDFRGFGTALAGTGDAAKLRTGGIVAEAIPSVERVADFIWTMHAANVPFKATAGLHHPLRGSYPLTYEPNAPKAVMHGFLNVFLAAAAINSRTLDAKGVIPLLSEQNAGEFKFTDDAAHWRDVNIPTGAIQEARENFAICFGSCSFDDPTEGLAKLGWL
jgi:hypothetical protein